MKLYQKLFQEMLEQNGPLFTRFKDIHDQFARDPDGNKQKFNEIGTQVMDVIRRYERQLVSSTEKSQYSKFSTGLSDKFWSGIRTLFPKIDFIGIK